MVSSSSRLAATSLAALCAAGCWTGRLFEAGRLSESVTRYDAVSLSGDSLRIDYTAERSGRLLLAPARARRAVWVSLAALSALPAYPVDALPIRQRMPDASAHGVPLRMVVGEGQETSEGDCEGAAAPLVVAIPTEAGRGPGLCICPRDGAPCAGYLPAEALYRDGTAWWVYPLIPVAVAIDIAVFPLQLVAASPFFLGGD